MSKTDPFWVYAEAAMLFASDAETDEEKQALFDLARIWTQAALLQRVSSDDHDTQPETSAA